MPTTTMTPAEVAQGAFEAVNAHDLDRLASLTAPDATDDFVAVGEFHGVAAIRGFFAETLGAFPDFAMVVENVAVDGSTVVTQWHATGTFTGTSFQGIEPTGKKVLLRGVDIMVIEGGLLRRNTVYYDALSLARQIGLLPRADSPADHFLTKLFNLRTRLTRRR